MNSMEIKAILTIVGVNMLEKQDLLIDKKEKQTIIKVKTKFSIHSLSNFLLETQFAFGYKHFHNSSEPSR